MKSKKAQGMKLKISPASPFRKKAQMKIQQMSFMLLGVFLFFALVGMIIVTVKFSGLKQSATDLKEQNAILLAAKLANSPEFSCGEVYGTQKTDCIDEDKIMMLKENIDKYTGFWGVSNIEIRRIYPKNNGINCTISNYPNCDTIKLIEKPISGFDYSNFVTLCRKEKYENEVVNKCEMSRIIIRYEEVK
jgi:hypothetical protein